MDIYRKLIEDKAKETLKISNQKNNEIQGSIKVNEEKLLYLAIPYDKNWKEIVNGDEQKVKIINAGLIGLNLKKGNNVVQLKYVPIYRNWTLVIMIIGIGIYVGLAFLGKIKKKSS